MGELTVPACDRVSRVCDVQCIDRRRKRVSSGNPADSVFLEHGDKSEMPQEGNHGCSGQE